MFDLSTPRPNAFVATITSSDDAMKAFWLSSRSFFVNRP